MNSPPIIRVFSKLAKQPTTLSPLKFPNRSIVTQTSNSGGQNDFFLQSRQLHPSESKKILKSDTSKQKLDQIIDGPNFKSLESQEDDQHSEGSNESTKSILKQMQWLQELQIDDYQTLNQHRLNSERNKNIPIRRIAKQSTTVLNKNLSVNNLYTQMTQ